VEASGEGPGSEFIIHPHPEMLADSIKEILDNLPFIFDGNESQAARENTVKGLCMGCNNLVGERAVVIISGEGIQAISCSGLCMDDMISAGLMSEILDDIRDRMVMRHEASGDRPIEGDEGPEEA
jgi:hypothetical protein